MAAPNSGLCELDGRRAVIIGGGGEIGAAICQKMVEVGARVLVADIDNQDTIAAGIGGSTLSYRVDVTKEEEMAALADYAMREMGGVDILGYLAGLMHMTPLESLSLQEWKRDIAVNLTGAFLACRSFVHMMKRQGGGKIFFMGSVAAQLGGTRSGPHYAASKGGLHSLAKWVAREGAPYGICANAIAPGPVQSKMTSAFKLDPASFLLGRLATTDDVAAAAVFLSSPASDYTTGVVLDVNGGMLMH